ncbi:MAG: DUF4913 domain-containing protein [Candidatus Ancillula sp.]|jgi:hypothetical protein|nr:DUF4913 domain-containing protein [Candidatus Ancillula sp.]
MNSYETAQILGSVNHLAEVKVVENAQIIAEIEPASLEVNDVSTRQLATAKVATKVDTERKIEHNNNQEITAKTGDETKIKKPQESEEKPQNQSSDTPKPQKTFYKNLDAFVRIYLCKMYATGTKQSDRKVWLTNWWKYPAIFERLHALWISWEEARLSNSKATWFLQIGDPMMNSLMDKEMGVMKHFVGRESENLVQISAGHILTYQIPPARFSHTIATALIPQETPFESRTSKRRRKEADV